MAAGVTKACVAALHVGPDEAKTNVTSVSAIANVSHHEQHMQNSGAAGVITTVFRVMHSMDSEGKFRLCFGSSGCGIVAVVSDVCGCSSLESAERR